MGDIRTILSDAHLGALRQGYDRASMTSAMVTAIEGRYPPLAAWNREIERLFYREDSPLAPRDRERCLIALLAQSGPPLSLAVHLYWGLMEGMCADEICHTLTLTACYGGVPRLAEAFPALERVLAVVEASAAAGVVDAGSLLTRILNDFTR